MYMYTVPHDLVSDKNGLEEGPKWNATSTPTDTCIYICIYYNIIYTCTYVHLDTIIITMYMMYIHVCQL